MVYHLPTILCTVKKWLKKHGLTWPGTSAKSNGYQIQRSTDGINFATVASVSKPGNNNTYTYEDPSPAKGNNYYRLVYKANAGADIYSNILLIEYTAINIFPNPVTESLHIRNMQGKKAFLKISDMAGNIKFSASTNAENFNWNVSALHKGYYVLCIESVSNEPLYRKFYKE